MNIWLPYVEGGSGTDVFTHSLADGLRDLGHRVNVQRFAHHWQYFPWRLKAVPAPSGCEAIIANSWNAFAFRRSGCRLLAVEHLCVLDPALTPYRSFPQSVFHNTLVRHYERASAKAADITVAVDVLGTTGEAFTAGIAWGLARRLPLERTLLLGNALGGLATRRLGAQTSLPDWSEVAAITGVAESEWRE